MENKYDKKLKKKVAVDIIVDMVARTLKKEQPEVVKLLQDEVKKEVEDDFAEVLNNLEDDLGIDFTKSGAGYDSYEKSYKAVKKFTYKILCKKFKKYGGKLMID